MAATLIAVVLAIVLGHVAPAFATSVRDYGWFGNWLRWLDSRFPEGGAWRGRYGIALAVLPPLLLVALFQVALDAPLLGLVGLLFGIVVLFYSWGPRDLDLDVEAIVSADDPVARREAALKLWPDPASAVLDPPGAVSAVFRAAQRRWFGVLFWFLLLGAAGALLYRLAALAAEGEESRLLPPQAAAGARWLHALMDWPVAQLMTLAMALAGNFDTVVGAWKDNGGASFKLDTDFLAAAGRASVRIEVAEEAEEYVEEGITGSTALLQQLGEMPELRDAMSLVWRILLLWLAVLALFVLAGWVA
jgi:AmpE protein